ncbi:MAG: nucleotide sugar dehydrogenase [Candidatus Brocadiaceae bacterium]|nr:nucleotide sugar dehydrogenase [Candidatus Brocadiaceae bacterium]
MKRELLNTIENRAANIGIIGLGYVGLPLVLAFHKTGFPVTGFDLDLKKVKALKEGKSYIKHIPAEKIRLLNTSEKTFDATTDFSLLNAMDCILICVPTPLSKHREPDLSYVFNTTVTIRDNLKKGQLIILESTTYPGTTDEDMRSILEEKGMKAGKDFFLAYSPEREDPNNKNFTTGTIPKVVGGYTSHCLELTKALYETIVVKTVPVSSTKTAEATKLLENIYRAVNIALVNELKVLFDRMGIDIWEVVDAASTKPFGFVPFFPGPGLGGHCIPIDPFYLTWKAREYDISTKFIELAGEINTSMPYYVVQKTIEALNDRGKNIGNAEILILGLAYKKDIDDVRESPSLKIKKLLEQKVKTVDYNDPYITKPKQMRAYKLEKASVPLTADALQRYACVIILTDHSVYDPEFIVKHSQLIVDTRNLIKNASNHEDKIVKA